jgi:hypothetical protein
MSSSDNNFYGKARDQGLPQLPVMPQQLYYAGPSRYPQHSGIGAKKKAVMIGINYFCQRGQLRGSTRDVKNMAACLNVNFGYQRENMVILSDDQQHPLSQPTKANILQAMHCLTKDAQSNDSLVFYYSGHGPKPAGFHENQEDAYTEVMYPVDFRSAGLISSLEVHKIMVEGLSAGVKLKTILDYYYHEDWAIYWREEGESRTAMKRAGIR